MLKPKVSVLITFYNQEEYVDCTISSVIDQITDFETEIIIGDDDSSDNTQERVLNWIEKYPNRIRLVVMKGENKEKISGFRSSRNRLELLKHVNGEYFIFLDGDDYYEYEYKIQKQVEVLEKASNSDCVACAHNMKMIYADGRVIPTTSYDVKEGKYDNRQYWRRMYFHTDSLLVRSTIIESIPTKLVENNFNDNMITYLVIQCGKIYYLPYLWAVYRQTGTGIWTEGNRAINCVRNLYLYDLANIINPQLTKETDSRFFSVWRELLKYRRSIMNSDLGEFRREAFDKELLYSNKWINIGNSTALARIKLYIISGWKYLVGMARSIID